MLEAIYSSKLYRLSPRKDKIRAAMDNPVNKELIGQLAEALGDNYRKPEYLVKDYNDKGSSSNSDNLNESDDTIQNDKADIDISVDTTSNSSGVSHSSNSDNVSDDLNPENNTSSDSGSEHISSKNSNDDSTSESGSEPVQESISLFGDRIVGSQIREKFKNMQQVSDEIKGLLNFKDSTQGVNRILVKQNELWIYYNDDINLNNVMSEVIETLNGSGYTYLEFNRLARSDNSIVFQILFRDTDNIMKPYNN